MKILKAGAVAASVVVFCANSGYALDVHERASLFDGGYVGVQVGHNTASFDYKQTVTSTGAEVRKKNPEGEDVVFGALVGVGWVVNDFYAGFEGDYDYYGIKESSKFPGEQDLTFEAKYGLGVGVRLGYQIMGRVMPYVKGGYHRARFKFSQYDAALTNPVINKFEKSVNGFELGGGIEVGIHKNVSLRIDYVHAFYDRVKYVTPDASDDTFMFDPSEDKARFGVLFRF